MQSESSNFDLSRPAGRAIVIRDGQMLVMKRTRRSGKKYMVTPGGRLEDGESPEEAVIREVKEETTIAVRNPRLVFIEEPESPDWGTQFVYICEYVSGEPRLPENSEEYGIQQGGGGTYEPVWLDCALLNDSDYPFLSPRLGEEIRKGVIAGFPDTPIRWSFDRV